MSIESAVHGFNASSPAVRHPELPASDAATSVEAARSLQQACHIVAPLYQGASARLDETAERLVTWALDGAVRQFVAARREAGLPPERVLVELMGVVKLELLEPGPHRGLGDVRGIVFRAFLDAYFDGHLDR